MSTDWADEHGFYFVAEHPKKNVPVDMYVKSNSSFQLEQNLNLRKPEARATPKFHKIAARLNTVECF